MSQLPEYTLLILKRFTDQMEIELVNNQSKGDVLLEWKGISEKLQDLQYHISKAIIGVRMGRPLSIKEYIADCANILMSIGHELRLYDEDSRNDGMQSELVGDVFKQFPIGENKRGNFLENIK